MEEGHIYDNPFSSFRLKVGFCLILLMIIFVSGTSIVQQRWDAFAFGMLLALIILYVLLYSELIQRPKMVSIGDDGVNLKYRTWKPLFAPWNEIEWVDAVPADKSTLKGKDIVEGRMKIRAKYWPMLLTYEIAHAVQLKYNQQFGRYPPISPSLAQRREHEARQRARH